MKTETITAAGDPFQDARKKAAAELAIIHLGDWLTTGQAARYFQQSPSSFEKARSTGKGPLATLPYYKLGRSVRYHRQDLIDFAALARVQGNRKDEG